MEPLTTADLPFAEQVAETEALAAANRVLSALGKPALAAMSLDDDERRRYACAIVIGRTSDPETLRRIALERDNGDWQNNDVLCAVTRHPATPLDVIIRLAWNPYVMVSDRPGADPRIPVAELEMLAKHGPLGGRMSVAVNPSAPQHVIDMLAADPSSWVRSRVARRPEWLACYRDHAA